MIWIIKTILIENKCTGYYNPNSKAILRKWFEDIIPIQSDVRQKLEQKSQGNKHPINKLTLVFSHPVMFPLRKLQPKILNYLQILCDLQAKKQAPTQILFSNKP